MSSFIDKFFGLVKNIVTGKKKETQETQEPEVLHEIQEQEMIYESEIQEQEHEEQIEIEQEEQSITETISEEHEMQEHEPQPEEIELQEPEQSELQPEEHELQPEETELQEPEQSELQPEEHELQPEESELQEPERSELQPETIEHQPEEHEPQPEETEIQEPEQSDPQPKSPETERKDEYDYTYISLKIRNIIVQHYSYTGFAINDTHDYSLFRSYAKSYELELPASDSELRRLIVCSGTLIDGNVYVFSHDDVQRMIREVQRMLDDGVNVIYFRELEYFIEDSNLYLNLPNSRVVCEILRDNYSGCIFTERYMETSVHKTFRSYLDGLRYILAKYFPDGFDSDYALLREYAAKENIILSGNDKALKRETEALKR